MKNLLPILLLIIFISSCKKDELSFTIKGQVSDLTLSGNLSGATVKLYSFPLGSTLGVFENSVSTDAQGNYSFELEHDKYEKIQLVLEKGDYFEIIDDISFSNLSTTDDNVLNYGMEAKAWTKFIIKNQQPTSAQDEFKLFKNSGKIDCAECCNNGYTYYYGAVDTVVYCANGGNRYMSFFYWVNGNEDNGNDSVYNTPFDTTSYEFYY
ncbi:MAG: hypothetical protein COA32_09395 [Fluviicola sp.]|nr:MAG: hypothetical protein COA32_09395 [Fluviicola sp.]